ncbi:MAG: M36 family metallopeptidase, partial [Actinomycetota bacterium]|nr:M36 family metallopeptidase [Actinomycetota bacterium]
TASPRWEVFPANPQIADPANGDAPATSATRETWCWEAGDGCDRVVGNPASRAPWDVDTRTGASTFTTTGNNARTAPSFVSFVSPDAGAALQPYSLSRSYAFDFTNQWYREACDPAAFASTQKNDLDAASTNLFVGHNRIHDWAYFLGFTEETWNLQTNNFGNNSEGQVPGGGGNDPELGQTQAGAVGGGPAFTGRDNANQITLQDGIPGITNQYLWQPLQAGFYAPCVDGAYDASVIAHEYGHAVQNRMVAGPDAGLSGHQSRAMGESWSDLTAVEYLNSYGLAGKTGEDPFAVGAFVTGDKDTGIRNYNMSRSPLNFSNLGYDGNGATSPHADGEIWSATNYTVRQALAKKYDATFPSTDAALQARCADGVLPADACPGNRRWVQIMHDAFLLQLAATDMTTARDAYLAADRLRFGGANQAELWTAFAQRGLGAAAASQGPADLEATPSFAVPAGIAGNSTVTFTPAAADGGAAPTGVKVYVGQLEARSVPAATGSIPSATLVAGSYEFVATAPGFATTRFSATVVPGTTAVAVPMRRNLAAGGTVTGAGVQQDKLVDGTEATNAALLNGTVKGHTLVVKLGDTAQPVTEVNVSAALRPADGAATGDTGGQSRFSAVRSFEVLTCATGCTDPAAFTSAGVFRDAFPADRPRPTVPDLALRSFDIPDTTATHVAIRVVDNQCTGGQLYTGAANPDADPINDPDCVSGQTAAGATAGTTSLSQAANVRIAELQVLGPVAPVATLPGKKPRK